MANPILHLQPTNLELSEDSPCHDGFVKILLLKIAPFVQEFLNMPAYPEIQNSVCLDPREKH